jgi:hypothetical protein
VLGCATTFGKTVVMVDAPSINATSIKTPVNDFNLIPTSLKTTTTTGVGNKSQRSSEWVMRKQNGVLKIEAIRKSFTLENESVAQPEIEDSKSRRELIQHDLN